MAKYTIIYSPKFWPRLNDILAYLSNTWGPKVANNFLDLLESKIILLSINPKLGRISAKRSDVRSMLITKHNKLYYQFRNSTVQIVTLFDTRQNPSKNKYE